MPSPNKVKPPAPKPPVAKQSESVKQSEEIEKTPKQLKWDKKVLESLVFFLFFLICYSETRIKRDNHNDITTKLNTEMSRC